jgi:hypothetical protein
VSYTYPETGLDETFCQNQVKLFYQAVPNMQSLHATAPLHIRFEVQSTEIEIHIHTSIGYSRSETKVKTCKRLVHRLQLAKECAVVQYHTLDLLHLCNLPRHPLVNRGSALCSHLPVYHTLFSTQLICNQISEN